MRSYIGLYNGESSKDLLTRSPVNLGGGPEVYLIDMMYDDACLEIKERLKGKLECFIKVADGSNMMDISNTVSRICLEILIKERDKDKGAEPEIFLEIGNLDNVMAGAMFLAAMKGRARIVNFHDGAPEIFPAIKPLPNVARRSYTAHKILDVLFLEDSLSYVEVRNAVYENEIAGKNEEERDEFFSTHNNTYKVLERLIKDGWVKYDGSRKLYSITGEGKTARVIFELRFLEEKQSP